MKEMDCLRCDGQMQFIKTEKLQLGKAGWIVGDWPHLIHGALDVEIWCCPDCGRLEFFRAEEAAEEEMPQKRCPACGNLHDVDWPKCPFCKHDYYAK